ncbi:UDP-glucose 4-epimerase [Rhodovibrio salinarum]|uniref:UDP-glucose 4-epimerase n=2 Tax=Rhodovibrio salinarum TaxID=1087 RepID=A0A934QGW8_9PROT|nr:polysaccharide biosynthesis protein [Rhodovibrio salinarum]MBK1696664.1 UDP-glucose 4-epimerase [Rhodovibrio salinarum]
MADKVVLITGGTGSFGGAMTRHLIDEGCGEIRILSRDEAKQDERRREWAHPALKFMLGDVRDRERVARAVEGVDYVFHAAALKQVPSCEFFPTEAVQTNVLGSQNVIEASVAQGVKRVVCLSTDKAVYPINAMGMSKALMEKTAIAAAREYRHTDTVVCCVRYGNVLYSRGSVMPLFVRLLNENKPLTITNPKMTRFLLSLENAVRLVDFAFENAQPGDLFIRKAPACTIETLARALQQLAGAETELKYIGTRHGEKLYETLATGEEMLRSEDMGEFLRIGMDERDLNYTTFFDEGVTKGAHPDDYHSHNTEQLDVDEAVAVLREIPELCRDLRL